MFKCFWVVLCVFGLSGSLHANTTAQDFPELKKYAKSLGAQPLNAMNGFHPETTFKDYNSAPIEKRYYSGVENTKTDLDAAAKDALKNDAGGKTVVEHFGKNQFEINQKNGAIQNAKLIEDESFAITHGISNERVKCDITPPACEIKTHVETCHTSRQLPVQSCAKKRRVAVTSEHLNFRADVVVVIKKKFTGTVSINLVTGAITKAQSGALSHPIQLNHPCERMTATIHSIINGGKTPDWAAVTGLPSCSNNGLLTISVVTKFHNAYSLQIALTIDARSAPFISDEHWDNDCAQLEAKTGLCHIKEEQCAIADKTRVIDGLAVTRDCWETTSTFSCATALADECASQREKGCLQSASFCALTENNECAMYEQSYRCSEKVCPAPIACVKDLFCADGDCTEHSGTQNDEFGKDIIPLAVVGEAGREYGQTQASLFGGHAVECKIEAVEFLNCCSNKGWGKSLDIAHCAEEDKALGQAKLNYLAHYLGRYCSHKTLSVCDEHKRTYCVFDTKMARIIQEDGRLKQLNSKALGTAKHPTCEGISVEELQSLDMGRIEFLKPEYPFNSGAHIEEAGIVVLPPMTSNINDEAIRRIQKKVGG